MNRFIALVVLSFSLIASAVVEPSYPWSMTPTPQYQGVGSAPPCNLSRNGNQFFDTILKVNQVCDGTTTTWVANGGVSSTGANPLVLFVDPVLGNDANPCTSSGAGACLTLQGTENKIPVYVYAGVDITPAAGTYTTGFVETGHTFGPQGYIHWHVALITFAPATGTATGTLTSYAPGTVYTWDTLNDTGQAWTAHNLQGRPFAIIGGTGAGQSGQIADNTATAITVAGHLGTALDATSVYLIQDWGATITGNSVQPTSMFQPGVQPPAGAAIPISAAIWVNNVPAMRDSEDVLNAPLVIQGFFFSGAGVSKGIVAQSGDLSARFNRFATTGSHGIVSYGGLSTLDIEHNFFTMGGNRCIQAGSASTTKNISVKYNVATSGSQFENIQISGAGLSAENSVSGMTAENIRVNTTGVFEIQGDHFTGGLNCLRTSQGIISNTSVATGYVSIDGITCNNPTISTISNVGASIRVDDFGTGSTGTNSNNVSVVLENTGAHYVRSAVTAFTEPAGLCTYQANPAGTSGFCFSDADLTASGLISIGDGSTFTNNSQTRALAGFNRLSVSIAGVPCAALTTAGCLGLSAGHVTLGGGAVLGAGAAVIGSFSGATAAVAAPATIGHTSAQTATCTGATAGAPIMCSPATTNQTSVAAEVVNATAFTTTDTCNVVVSCGSAACTDPPSVVYNCRNMQ